MVNKREEYIDLLRGVAIFLVTLGHVTQSGGYHGGYLYEFIYSFHMPLFFAISGFVASFRFRNYDDDMSATSLATYILKKFRTLLIPYLAWGLLIHPFFLAGYPMTWASYFNRIQSVVIDNTSAWFLPCLFGLSVIYAGSRYLYSRIKGWRDALRGPICECMILLLLVLIVGAAYRVTQCPFLRSVLSYALPYGMGILIGRYAKLDQIIVESRFSYVICTVSFCVAASFFIQDSSGVRGRILRLITGAMCIPVLFSFARTIRIHEGIKRMLVSVGQNTLIIYCLQNIGNLPDISGWKLSFIAQVIVFGTVSVAVVALSMLAASIIDRSAILREVMAGKLHENPSREDIK